MVLATAALPHVAHAQEAVYPAGNDGGDTAWVLASTALVLLMTLPGLALFYGGLVRAKNFLSVLLQIGAVASVASVLWIVVGYTLAFGPVSTGVIGGGLNLMLANLGNVREGLTIPESTFALF
ncbi:MAG: ammonium transporter, partial [Erythrobacter sp.]|nr:ammonium transporter [Erythrobacter sp.]